MSKASQQSSEPMLIEWVAEITAFDKIASKIPFSTIYPPYLYLSAFLLLDFGLINGYNHLTGGEHILLQAPTAVAGIIGVYLAAFGIRYMATQYRDAIDALQVSDRDIDANQKERFSHLVSLRLKKLFWVIAAVVLYLHVIVNIGINNLLSFAGPAALLNRLFVWQIGYLPFVVEFGLLFYGIHFQLPRRIKHVGLNMFFYDPRNMGGFAPVGQLLKRSYYLYTMGLLLFFILTYGVYIINRGQQAAEPGITEAAFFSASWLLGILSIGYSMWTVHQIMNSKKEQRIREIETEIRDKFENPFDINSSKLPDNEELENLERRMTEVRDTKVYPATFTMWSQITISVFLPQALQIAVQSTV